MSNNLHGLEQDEDLYEDIIRFNINGAYEYTGLTNTGSSKSITNPLTTTARRYILLRDDTYSSDVVLANDNTTFTPAVTGFYVSCITAEIYDNSADAKTIYLELYGHTEGASLQIVRHTAVGSSTNYEYANINGTKIVSLTAGNQYFYKAYSTNGGVINALSTITEFHLTRIKKSF